MAETKQSTKKAAPKAKPAPKAKANGKADPQEYQPAAGEQQYIGQGTGESAAPTVIQPLIDLARRHEKTKAALKKLKDTKKAEDGEGLIMFGKYEEYFTKNEKGDMVYEALGVTIIIQEKGVQFETRATPTKASALAEA